MKNYQRKIHLLYNGAFLVISIFAFSACASYQNLTLAPKTDEPWKELIFSLNPSNEKIINIRNEDTSYELQNFTIKGDSISGLMVSSSRASFTPEQAKVFQGDLPPELKEVFDNVIFIETEIPIHDGQFAMAYSDATGVNRYWKKGKNNNVSKVAGTVVGTTAVVAIAAGAISIIVLLLTLKSALE